MGSGSSKSRRRVISICGQEPLHPKEISKGENAVQGNVVNEQKERDEGKTAMATQSVLEPTDSRPPPVDPDLQLLDDILTESKDCLSWQEPICKGQKMRNSLHTNCNFESLSQGQKNQRQDKQVPRMLRIKPELHPVSSENEQTQYRPQNIGDGCSKMAPGTRRVFDFENNNLPMQSDACPVQETKDPLAYDGIEEALMDSIEQEYSQLHLMPPTYCGKL